MKNFLIYLQIKSLEKFTGVIETLSKEDGGFSPLVVTIGLALIFIAVILTASPTLRTAVSGFIQKVIDGLTSLET